MCDIPGCEVFPRAEYKRTQSLKEIVVSADVSSVPEGQANLPKGHLRYESCSVCYLSVESKIIDFTDQGFSHVLTNFSNCNTRMCVYLLTCKYQLRYVVSTQRKLKVCLQEHLSQIRHQVMEAPLVQHFVNQNHQHNMFMCIALEVVTAVNQQHRDLYRYLLQCETYWILKLNILFPNGLNQEIDYSIFL